MTNGERKVIKQMLPVIFRHLSKFIIRNKMFNNHQQLIKGEAYTLIRRHLPELVTGSGETINIRNIQDVKYNYNTGEIISFSFCKSYSSSDLVPELNQILDELNLNYSNINLSISLENITNKIENYNFK